MEKSSLFNCVHLSRFLILPWLLACWSLVDLGLYDLVVSGTFSCLQKFVCNVPMGWDTGSTPFLVLQEPSVLLSSTTLMSLPFGKRPSLRPAFFVTCPFMMKSLFPLCVTLTLLQKLHVASWLPGGTSLTLWEIVIWVFQLQKQQRWIYTE